MHYILLKCKKALNIQVLLVQCVFKFRTLSCLSVVKTIQHHCSPLSGTLLLMSTTYKSWSQRSRTYNTLCHYPAVAWPYSFIHRRTYAIVLYWMIFVIFVCNHPTSRLWAEWSHWPPSSSVCLQSWVDRGPLRNSFWPTAK